MRKRIKLVFLLTTVAICCLLAAGLFSEQTVSLNLQPPLLGLRIVIDPGHGGLDDGTRVADHCAEKDINLQMGLELRDTLQRMGAEVIMTRETDRELSRFSKVYNGRHREDLAKRVQIIETSECDLFVSLHCNSAPGHPAARGPVVYFQQNLPVSMTLAETIQSRLNRMNLQPYSASQRPHTVCSADYYLLRNATVPGVLVEAGFLSNGTDQRLLADAGFQRAFAASLALGIGDYLHREIDVQERPASSTRLAFIVPVDENQPTGWSELLSSPLPLTFLLDGESLAWSISAEQIRQAGHDLLLRATAHAMESLSTGIYRTDSGAASSEVLTVSAPALIKRSGHQVTAVINAATFAQLQGQLEQILQSDQTNLPIVLLNCTSELLQQLPSAWPALQLQLRQQATQPVFCSDLLLPPLTLP